MRREWLVLLVGCLIAGLTAASLPWRTPAGGSDAQDARIRFKMAAARAKGESVLFSLNGLSGDPNWIFTSKEDGEEADGVCLMGPGHCVPWLTVHRNWTVDVNDPNCLTDGSVRRLLETEQVQKILMDMPLDALGWKFEYRSPPIDIRDVAPRVYDPNGLTDDVIRKLCSSGRVCEVMGHQWGWAVNVDRPYVFNHRMCRLCGQIAEDPRMAEDPRAERDKVPFPENGGGAMLLPYDGSWRLTEWQE